MNTFEEKLWVEKYRPKTIQECVLPKEIKNTLLQFVEQGECPNLILHSSQAGAGKTTVARALCEQIGFDTLFINASLENGIDTLRNKIATFATTISLTGNMKCVILDEGDFLSQSMQPALRGFIEQFSTNVRFIFTCNYLSKILPPIQSRCTCISFDVPQAERNTLMKQAYARVVEILKAESVKFDPKTVLKLVVKFYPDMRRTLNDLQRYSAGGEITEPNLNILDQDNITTLVGYLRDRRFSDMRMWIGNNKDSDPEKIFRWFYDNASNIVKPESVPQVVLTTSEYQYKTAFVADQEINLCAYFTELMLNCEFLKNE